MKNLTLAVKVQIIKDVYLLWLPKLKHKLMLKSMTYPVSPKIQLLTTPKNQVKGDPLVRQLFKMWTGSHRNGDALKSV